MSRRKALAAMAARCTVAVCGGCCCGTPKVPGVDHAAQLAELKARVATIAQVRAVNCLDACEQANVIVVHRLPPDARRAADLSGSGWATTRTRPVTSLPGYAPGDRASPNRPTSATRTPSTLRDAYDGPSKTDLRQPACSPSAPTGRS
jgi:hypothetical protein